MSIDAIIPTPSFGKIDWMYNYPVQLRRIREGDDDDPASPATGEVGFVAYMPRKQACYESDGGDVPHIPPEEAEQFIENSITKFKTAIALFEAFRDGHIDSVTYWDLER